MTYQIDKDVPFGTRIPNANLRYPFDKMEVGDSILVETENTKNAQVAASTFGRRYSKVFATRRCVGGLRIWRRA